MWLSAKVHGKPSIWGSRVPRYRDPAADEVTLVCSGEGATSEGEFWQALNAACLGRLPVVFLIEDNGYAISVPLEAHTAGGSISALTASFPGLLRQEVDGTDVPASYGAMQAAVACCREGRGPGSLFPLDPISGTESQPAIVSIPGASEDTRAADRLIAEWSSIHW